MVLCYDKSQKCLQAGIHTEAHFHSLTIKVRERGQATDLQTLILEHEHIKEIAPLFLYVEKKEGSGKPSGAATLYKPNDLSYRQAFANVMDLQSEAFHKHDHLMVKPDVLAPLNILSGEFYSSSIGKATRINMAGPSNPFNLGLVTTRVACDISSARGNLILRSKDHKAKPILHLPLNDGKHYEVSIFNEPTDDHKTESDHAHAHSGAAATQNDESPVNHFNVYYEAIVLKDGVMKYTVEIEEDPGPVLQVLPLDPPCELVRLSGTQRLPDFG
jgi:hypothetical protein